MNDSGNEGLHGDTQAAINSAVGRKDPDKVRTIDYPDRELFHTLAAYEVKAISRGPDFSRPVSRKSGIFAEKLKNFDSQGKVAMFFGNLSRSLHILEYSAYASTFTLRNPHGDLYNFEGHEKYSTDDLRRLKLYSEMVAYLDTILSESNGKKFRVEVDALSYLADTDKESSFVPPYTEPGKVTLKCNNQNQSLSVTLFPMEKAIYYDPTDSDGRLSKLAKKMKHATRAQVLTALTEEYGNQDQARNIERLEKLEYYAKENAAESPYMAIDYTSNGQSIHLRGELVTENNDGRNSLGFRLKLPFGGLSMVVPIIKNAQTRDPAAGVISRDTDALWEIAAGLARLGT